MEENKQMEQALLKTCMFGGFEKKQVLTYIDRLREQNLAAMTELETRMEQMSAARGELANQVGSFERKITELEEQLDQRGEHIRELTGVIDGLKGEIERQQRNTVDLDRELSGQREQNRQLMLKANTSEYKARRYDDVSSQVGEIMIEAQKSAREVLAAAEQKAVEIQDSAITATEHVSGEIYSLRTDLGTIRSNLEQAMRAFSERLDAIDGVISEMESRRASCQGKQESDLLEAFSAVIDLPESADAEPTAPAEPERPDAQPLTERSDDREPRVAEPDAPRSFFRRAAQA